MRKLSEILVLFFLFTAFSSKAQQTTFDQTRIIYQRQWMAGVFIHTQGWGIDYKIGKNLTGFKKRLWEFELLTMKHPKEIRQYNQYANNTKGYFYGKENALYILRTGIGLKNIFAPKQTAKGVAISYIASIGPSIGFAKPIYLVIMQQGYPYVTYKTEKYDPEKDFVDNIYGRASGLMGIGEIKLYPGLYSKFGLNLVRARIKPTSMRLKLELRLMLTAKKYLLWHQVLLTIINFS